MAKIVDLYSNVIRGGIARSNEYVLNFVNFKTAEPGSSERTLQNQLEGIIGDNVRLNYFGTSARFSFDEPALDYDKISLDQIANGETSKLNFLCDEVYVPGVNYSYGTVKGVYNGNDIKYAYGKTYSDLSMTFILDKNSYPKKFFDTWMNYIADTDPKIKESKQLVNSPILFKYPDQYCADILIIKLERSNNTKNVSSLYFVKRAFPSAISPIQLSNGVANLLKLNVTFTYQRWWARHYDIR